MIRSRKGKTTRRRIERPLPALKKQSSEKSHLFLVGSVHYDVQGNYRLTILRPGSVFGSFVCRKDYDLPNPVILGAYSPKPSEEGVFYSGFLRERTVPLEKTRIPKLNDLEKTIGLCAELLTLMPSHEDVPVETASVVADKFMKIPFTYKGLYTPTFESVRSIASLAHADYSATLKGKTLEENSKPVDRRRKDPTSFEL